MSVLLAACDPGQPCDPGQNLVGGVCHASAPPAPDAGTPAPDAGAPAPDAGTGAPDAGAVCEDKHSGFGAACSSVSQCPCGLDFCIAFTGYYYCTHTGCLQDPGICPEGWVCYDLAAYGYPAICVKP